MYIHTHIYIYIYTHKHTPQTSRKAGEYICTRIYVHVHTYTYTYTYIYTHTYIYTYVYLSLKYRYIYIFIKCLQSSSACNAIPNQCNNNIAMTLQNHFLFTCCSCSLLLPASAKFVKSQQYSPSTQNQYRSERKFENFWK